MRKTAISVWILSLAAFVVALLAPACLAADVSIIGGADSPTYGHYLLRSCNGLFLWVLALSVPAVLLSGLWAFGAGQVRRVCAGKTTAAALGISAAGGAGLAAALWFLVLSMGGPERYPVALPASTILGLTALMGFILMCVVYVALRRKQISIPGILADVATSIVFLPGFLCFTMWALDSLQELR